MSSMPRLLLVGLLLLPIAAVAAPESEEYETVVTPGRGEEAAFESPRAVQVTTRQQILDRAPGSTPQALENEPAVAMQRTNTAGGAPILRGLIGQHVLLLLDGVRLNNAITRYGPNQSLSTVDPYQIERAEIMRGPGSVLYGSDALGGVVNLITRKPRFDPLRAWDAGGDLFARFDSADTSVLGNLAATAHLRQVGLRFGGSLKRFDDLVGGRDTGRQRFTAYREGDADLSAAWAIGESSMLRASYAAVRQHDAPRTDRSTPSDFLLFSDQLRDLATINYAGRFERYVRRVDATVSFHHQREVRERFRIDGDRIERESDGVGSLGAQLALQSELPYNQLTYGFDLYHDWVSSAGESERISTTVVDRLARGRYVDGSRFLQGGLYLQDRLPLTRKLAIDAGVRLSTWNIDIPLDPLAGFGAVRATTIGAVGSLHGRYLLGDGLNLVAGVSQGFRAPNVDDFSALGCGGQGYDVPNPDLRPEQSVTAEAGVKIDLFGRLTGSLFYYFTYLHDLIVRVPSTLDLGSGPVSQFVCGTSTSGQPVMAPIYKRANVQSGNLHGVEAALQLALTSSWSIFAWVAWARGEAQRDDLGSSTSEPLSRVPPLNGLAGVRYQSESRRFVELAVRWAARQDRLSVTDLNDSRICPSGPVGCSGTAPYAVVTLRGGVRLIKQLRLTLAIENLTNETYRVHGSGVDGPGMSAVVGAELMLP
jgi:hemoglobin/transferrin/lactoferrin receptor protein